MRGEAKIAKGNLESCSSHGGINCQSGPDRDGSVICFDGFKAAAARFKFNCSSPNLKIAEVGERDKTGAFSVFVRNPSSIKAGGVNVMYKPEDQSPERKLEGPGEIDPFGLAEYRFDAKPPTLSWERVTIAQIDLTCANCN